MLSELSFEVTTFKVLHSTKEARCVSDLDQKDRLSWKWQYKWEKLSNLGINFEFNQVKFITSERATKFCEISTLLLSQSKVRYRFHKILWPSQNIWTLASSWKLSTKHKIPNLQNFLTEKNRGENWGKQGSLFGGLILRASHFLCNL